MAARRQPCCETNTMTESVDLAARVHGADIVCSFFSFYGGVWVLG